MHDRIYIVRPGAWYDKVMIDGWRNAVIAHLFRLIKLPAEHRCGSSDLFWGEDIELDMHALERNYRLVFGRDLSIILSRRETDKAGLTVWPLLMQASVAPVKSPEAAEKLAAELVEQLNYSIESDRLAAILRANPE